MIYADKIQLIRARMNRLNYDIMCHVQSKPVKKLIKAKLRPDVAELRPSLFYVSWKTKTGPPQEPGPRAPIWLNPSLGGWLAG